MDKINILLIFIGILTAKLVSKVYNYTNKGD